MRRFGPSLLACLPAVLARQPGFSPSEDLVAFPQYEVVFSDISISEHDAKLLVEGSFGEQTYTAEFPSHSDVQQRVRAASSEGKSPEAESPPMTYEIMNMPPSRYLCSIPLIQEPAPENQTANEVAKAEEARELARASQRGWELLKELGEDCLYFMSGWWSYRFCYNRDIVQFHAQPNIPNGQPPVPDPNAAAYILGRVPNSPSKKQPQQKQANQNQKPLAPEINQQAQPPNTDLQVKGDQRYLVQRLDGGTLCDLTGRERTIEVQYHCVPSLQKDRIGWIKEVTTCAYLMVVNTPRLCADVAFMPPQETTANAIRCQPIHPADDGDSDAQRVGRRTLEADDSKARGIAGQGSGENAPQCGNPDKMQQPIKIGGVVVGGRNVLSAHEGQSPIKLEPPKSYLQSRMSNNAQVEIVASRKSKEDGGELWIMPPEELEKLDLKPELVEDMQRKLEKLAGDKGWKLEVVDGEPREIRGIVDIDGSESEEEAKRRKNAEEEDGSEEQFFKEEL